MDPHEYLTIEDIEALTEDLRAMHEDAGEDGIEEEDIEPVIVVVAGGYAELFADGAVVAHRLVMGNVSDYLEHGADRDIE